MVSNMEGILISIVLDHEMLKKRFDERRAEELE
jgi:hypothetical protein